MKLKCFFVLLSLLCTTFSFGANYSVDQTHSQIQFYIKHLKKLNVKGTFRKFEGQASIENDLLKSAKGAVKVKTVFTGNKTRDRHLRSNDFF